MSMLSESVDIFKKKLETHFLNSFWLVIIHDG